MDIIFIFFERNINCHQVKSGGITDELTVCSNVVADATCCCLVWGDILAYVHMQHA